MSAADTSQAAGMTSGAAPRHLQAFPLFSAPDAHATSRWASSSSQQQQQHAQPARRPRRGRPPLLESTQRHIEALDTSTETTQHGATPHASTPLVQEENEEDRLGETQGHTSAPPPRHTPTRSSTSSSSSNNNNNNYHHNSKRTEDAKPPSTVPSVTNASSRPSLVSSQAEANHAPATQVDIGLVTSNLSSSNTNEAGNQTNNVSTKVNATRAATQLLSSAATPPPSFSPTCGAEEAIGAVFRRVYNDKLRESVQGILHTLAIDLPEDHVFRQLMADGLTAQYCKVRLGEVVENFLFATQAQQYYALTAELARKELDGLALQQRLERLEAELRLRAHTTDHTPVQQQQGQARDSEVEHSPGNPMAEEVARRELMTILEETTRQSELERGGRTVAEVRELIALVRREPRYKAKHEYVTDVLTSLYRTVRDFMHYVDASLESVEALRVDLAPPAQRVRGVEERDQQQQQQEDVVAAGVLVNGADHTPHTNSLSLSTAERISATRAQLRATLDALQEAQLQSVRVVDRLAHRVEEQSGETVRLRGTIEALREAQASALEAHRSETQTLRDELDACRRELVVSTRRAQDAEHAAAEARARQAAQRSENEQQQEKEKEEERRQLRMRAEAAEHTVRELQAELAQVRIQADEEAKKMQSDDAGATHHALLAAQEEAGRWQYALRVTQIEALVAKMERHESRLQGLYSESCNAKRALLEHDGYEAALRAAQRARQAMQETLRQAELTRQLADTALLERNVAERDLVDFLHALLRTMRNDVAEGKDDRVEALTSRGEHGEDTATNAVAAMSTALVPVTEEDDNNNNNTITTTVATGDDDERVGERRAQGQQQQPQQRRGAGGGQAQRTHETQPLARRPAFAAGLAAALQSAYDSLQRRHKAQVRQCGELRRQLATQDTLVHSVRQSGSALETQWHEAHAELDTARAELRALRDEAAVVQERLQRQELLLKSACEERDALRGQWVALNEDYVTLERRNSELHARCTDKEYENTRLLGLLQASASGAQPKVKRERSRRGGGGADVAVHIDPAL